MQHLATQRESTRGATVCYDVTADHPDRFVEKSMRIVRRITCRAIGGAHRVVAEAGG